MTSLRHLNKYFRKYKWRLILGILFAVLSTFFGIYVAVLVRKATDFMTHVAPLNLPEGGNLRLNLPLWGAGGAVELVFLKYGLLIIGTTIISGFLMFLMRQAIIVMSRHIEYDMKNEIFVHYQSLDMAFYRRNNTGDLMNRISEDVNRVRMYIGPAVMYFAGTIATIFLVGGTMTGVNAKLALYVLFPLPILVIVIYFVSDLINKMSNKVQEQLSKLSTIAQETFSGIRVVKSYVQEESAQHYFTGESEVYRKRYLGLIMVESLFSPFILLLMGLSTLLTIYIGGKQAIEGQISYGNIVEFVIYVTKLTWPVASLGWVTSLVQRAAASQKRINEFLNTKSSINSPQLPTADCRLPTIKGLIEFKNVSFIYPDSGIKAIDNISFKVYPGQSFAIIGKTGSGKSSIAGLLGRLYDVTQGEIRVDGKNLKEWDLAFLRRQIGYVPQDTFLFSDTVENNIAFGWRNKGIGYRGIRGSDKNSGSSSIPFVEQAAKDAGIYHEIMRFPAQFQTRIGERGITLSGGQKQRIAIARAIIDSPHLLIFDDCLSAVDTETEAEILSNLRRIANNKLRITNGKLPTANCQLPTVVFISHRVSTVKDASRILVLNNGRIEEEGTHRQLMNKKGFYYHLHQMQLAEKREADFKYNG